jgi:hypothetical protein
MSADLADAAIAAAVEREGGDPEARTDVEVSDFMGWAQLEMRDPQRGHALAVLSPSMARTVGEALIGYAEAEEFEEAGTL